jgi:hypothetical protein
MSSILPTQYELHDAFRSPPAFSRVLRFCAGNLGNWLRRTMEAINVPGCDNDDIFNSSVQSFVNLLGVDEALGCSSDKLSFFSQHVLSNMNELVSEWPFGKPKKAIFGFGGRLGAGRIRRGLPGTTSKNLHEVLEDIMIGLLSRSAGGLKLVGLYHDNRGNVRIKTNQRAILNLDLEHWCCVFLVISNANPVALEDWETTMMSPRHTVIQFDRHHLIRRLQLPQYWNTSCRWTREFGKFTQSK